MTTGISFTTMVLTLWTLCLGAYTWYWLRQPVRMVRFPEPPPHELSTQAQRGDADPEVNDGVPLQGLLLFSLVRTNGRLERTGRRGNNGLLMKYYQSRTWLLSCISHFAESSPADRERMRASIEEDYYLSENDESPRYGQDEPERQFAISTHHKAFDNIMGLLEYDAYEVTVPTGSDDWECTQSIRRASTALGR